MSSERQINTSLSILVSFMKERVASNLVEASNTGLLNVEEKEIQAVINLVNSSLEQSFSLGYSQVYTTLKELNVIE